ncbi:MAG TPA: protein translocase subunit SecF [Pyrinomonadaceae bacterium]|jgi:preprotein translocase subunit SecF
MVQFFKDVKFDWLGKRRAFIAVSLLLMLAGMFSAVIRYATGRPPFNLGVDFKGGTVITAKFKQRPSAEDVRAALQKSGVHDAVIQPVTDKPDEHLIKLPRLDAPAATAPNPQAGTGQQGQTQGQTEGQSVLQQPGQPQGATAEQQAGVDIGRASVERALVAFGPEVPNNQPFPAEGNAFQIVGTDAVGAIAGAALRNQAVAVTLLALVGILVFIALRFEWTYGAAAVIAVFHDLLVTLGFFSIFQWEISLTVIAALLTLVGFSVNDTIVTFDRIRENLRLRRRDSLYDITNDSINQTLSRTVITSGLVLLSVLALVLFGGEVLFGFSVALLIGIVFGTYSSIAIASPIMVWWQQRLEPARTQAAPTTGAGGSMRGGAPTRGAGTPKAKAAARGSQGAARS